MELRVGTSGFSYQDWVGAVYPETLKKHDGLTITLPFSKSLG